MELLGQTSRAKVTTRNLSTGFVPRGRLNTSRSTFKLMITIHTKFIMWKCSLKFAKMRFSAGMCPELPRKLIALPRRSIWIGEGREGIRKCRWVREGTAFAGFHNGAQCPKLVSGTGRRPVAKHIFDVFWDEKNTVYTHNHRQKR